LSEAKIAGAVIGGVNKGVNELQDSEFPALVIKAGCREAAGRLFKKIDLLINTTPALRATPPHLSRGIVARF
jgi:hypothetical protein